MSVDDVSKTQSYDLACRRNSEALHVEVKGTTGLGEKVLLPRNEVTHARQQHPNVALFVVHGINLSTTNPPEVSGGTVALLHPWILNKDSSSRLPFPTPFPSRTQ